MRRRARLGVLDESRDLALRRVVSGAAAVSLVLVAALVVLLDRSDSSPTGDLDRTIFRPIAVGAGGWVTGLSSSDDGRLRMAATDVSGAYRWDRRQDRWVDTLTAESLPSDVLRPGLDTGTLSVAVAPSDHRVAYVAVDDAVLRSDDAARTWRVVLDDVIAESNDDFRGWGDRLVVDPANPDVVWYGTQLDGLLTSNDGGRTWRTVETSSVPVGQQIDLTDEAARGDLTRPTTVVDGVPVASPGITAVGVAPDGTGSTGRSTIYAAAGGNGVHRSVDGGDTWEDITPAGMNGGAVPSLRVLADGSIVLTLRPEVTRYTGAASVWRLQDGQWTEVTPPQPIGWHAIAADPRALGRLVLIAQGGQVALTENMGDTWRTVGRRQEASGDVPWLSAAVPTGSSWMSIGEVIFDPTESGRLWLGEGVGVWSAEVDERTTRVVWRARSRGIEELVPTDVVVPPGGEPVLAAWDRALFRSPAPRRFPRTYGPTTDFSGGWSLDWSGEDPSYLAASVASHQAPADPSGSGFSTDGGRTWTAFASVPMDSKDAFSTFGFGSVAVGKPGNLIWAPSSGRRPHVTHDGGGSWEPVVLPGNPAYDRIDAQPYYVRRRVVASDKAETDTFYLFAVDDGFYRSTDGARSWEMQSAPDRLPEADWNWNVTLKVAPDAAGVLFMSPGPLSGITDQPFVRSTDGGSTWAEVSGLRGVSTFGFGAPLREDGPSAVFAAGYLEGRYGIYRSGDLGRSWTRLTDYPDGQTQSVVAMTGDPDVPGRVLLGLAGHGWVYGEPAGRASGARRGWG